MRRNEYDAETRLERREREIEGGKNESRETGEKRGEIEVGLWRHTETQTDRLMERGRSKEQLLIDRLLDV
jgi:hypothetical protein